MSGLTTTPGSTLASRLRSKLAPVYGHADTSKSCLLLDLSGSMESPVVFENWNGAKRIDELRKLAADFKDIQRYVFGSTVRPLTPLEDIPGCMGGTNMAAAFDRVKKDGFTHVVIITDGEPDSQPAALASAIGLKVDCFYVGPDPMPMFMETLGKATGGSHAKTSLDMRTALEGKVREKLMLGCAERGAIRL